MVNINLNIDRYFNIAKQASKLSNYPRIHIGACIVYKKQVLAIGYNSLTTHPMQREYNIYRNTDNRQFDIDRQSNFLHAEMACLIATKHLEIDWNKCSMFVYREDKSGSQTLSKPCRACSQSIIDRGIHNIYYTTENGYNYERI